jgi:hypothetical protein
MHPMVNLWHNWLSMPKHDEVWHLHDMQDELEEYHTARGIVHKWSEVSDVVYTYTRGKWSGHHSLVFLFSRRAYVVGLVYMFPKYTLQWLFFRKSPRYGCAAQGHRGTQS